MNFCYTYFVLLKEKHHIAFSMCVSIVVTVTEVRGLVCYLQDPVVAVSLRRGRRSPWAAAGAVSGRASRPTACRWAGPPGRHTPAGGATCRTTGSTENTAHNNNVTTLVVD